MVYAVLSMARSEIVWLFQHWGENPKVNKKGYKEEYFQDENVAVLIHYSQEMARLVETYIPCAFQWLTGAYRRHQFNVRVK